MEPSNYPREVIIEVTNHCNLKCVMCHFHGQGVTGTRPRGTMARELWTRVIDELGASGEPVALMTHGAGEPLLNGELEDIVRYAKRHPNISVSFLTNGMLLSEDVSRWVIDSGLDRIIFSVDGIDPASHASYRVNSDLAVIEKNIGRLAELRGQRTQPYIRFNMVRLPHLEDQIETYVKRWQPIAENIMISKYRPVGARTFLEQDIERFPCPMLFKQMVIGWDGRVGLCCEDIFIDEPLGDLTGASIREVWTGAPMERARRLHNEARYEDVTLCRRCDAWAGGEELSRGEREDGWIQTETPAQTIYHRPA